MAMQTHSDIHRELKSNKKRLCFYLEAEKKKDTKSTILISELTLGLIFIN